MKQHKWHKEIKAWADGAEIQSLWHPKAEWLKDPCPRWAENIQYRIKPQPKKILDEIGEAEIKQMLDDIEWYQKRVEELENIHKDLVMICKKCGDDLGIVYEPKEPQYLYASYHPQNSSIRLLDYEDKNSYYIGKIKLEVDE